MMSVDAAAQPKPLTRQGGASTAEAPARNAMAHLLTVRRRVFEQLAAIESIEAVLAGQADLNTYRTYLQNVYAYASHSAEVIALAASRCVRSHPAVSRYLLQHSGEEMGHELWALEDLRALGVDEESVQASRPVPACSSMIAFEYFVAGRQNPVGLFGWLYVLESMGDDLGGLIATAVQVKLGSGRGGVKFLDGHGIADQEHTADLTRVITDHLHDPRDIDDINYVADVVADLYVRMFREITKASR